MISLNATYTQSQVVTNATLGRYNTVLRIAAEPAGIVGTYACTVSNFRGSSVTRSITVRGETYFLQTSSLIRAFSAGTCTSTNTYDY